MNTDRQLISGRRTSFLGLLDNIKLRVEIPIIQRDYAQGRDSAREIRRLFLEALFSYLQEGRPLRDLDFVYGSVEGSGPHGSFVLLDGQQRLTTLFLLHWYLAVISKNEADFKERLMRGGTSMFTYQTRISSADFCDGLIKSHVDMMRLAEPDKNRHNELSNTIRDFGWFHLGWENDPSVKGMLNILDDIHHMFAGHPEFYAMLTDEQQPVITFLCLNLEEFKMTDELYIKMNSRGKPLTPFENFKAQLEQHISRLDPAMPADFKLSHVVEHVSMKEYFSFRMDTAWTDLFWRYSQDDSLHTSDGVSREENFFDAAMMRFMRMILAGSYAAKNTMGNSDLLEYLFDTQVAKQNADYTEKLNFQRLSKNKVLDADGILALIDAFDCLQNGTEPIRQWIKDTYFFDERAIFGKVLEGTLQQEETVQFYAYWRFLSINKGNYQHIDQWMRIVCNLTTNTEIDSAESVTRAIAALDKLLPYSADILAYLASPSAEIGSFFGRQGQEERLKAFLILQSDAWKRQIDAAERIEYFTGQILFLFEFAGVLAYFEKYGHCGWNTSQDLSFLAAFCDYRDKSAAVMLMQENGDDEFLWVRALLTKGDYLWERSQQRKNFMNTTHNLRDYSWKRLLRIPPVNALHDGYGTALPKRMVVKALLDDSRLQVASLSDSLRKIIADGADDWRHYFIRRPELIKYCKQGFIRFEGPEDIYLYFASQLNHTHLEMRMYDLYLDVKSSGESFAPFSDIVICNSKDFGGWLGVYWEVGMSNKLSFGMAISRYAKNNTFDVSLYRLESPKNQEEYPDLIVLFCRKMGFQWYDEDPSFYKNVETIPDAMDLIRTIQKFFKELLENNVLKAID